MQSLKECKRQEWTLLSLIGAVNDVLLLFYIGAVVYLFIIDDTRNVESTRLAVTRC